jgi:hypothetical protein
MQVPSAVVAMSALALLSFALSGCVSPGQPYTYLDIKFANLPLLTPAQPTTNQSVTVSFAIRNTWNQDLLGVPYVVYQNTDPLVPTSGTVVVPTTLVDIPAFGAVPVTFTIPAQAAGNYTYAVVLDQAQSFPERDFTDNTATFSVTFADQDISFASESIANGVVTPLAPTITDLSSPGNPRSADALTLNFSILNTVNFNQTAPQPVPVTYQVQLNGVVVFPATTVSVPPSTTAPNPALPLPAVPADITPFAVPPIPLPATGSAGAFTYVIILSCPAGLDSNANDNVSEAFFVIPAGN